MINESNKWYHALKQKYQSLNLEADLIVLLIFFLIKKSLFHISNRISEYITLCFLRKKAFFNWINHTSSKLFFHFKLISVPLKIVFERFYHILSIQQLLHCHVTMNECPGWLCTFFGYWNLLLLSSRQSVWLQLCSIWWTLVLL